MNNNKILGILIFIGCLIPKVKSNSFLHYSIIDNLNNKKIAIIPIQIVFPNNILKSLSAKEIETLSAYHSIAYQKELESILIEKYSEKISVENIQNTNKILKDSGIDLRYVWTYPLVRLHKILNVDGIFFMKIEQYKPFQNFASYNLFFPDLYSSGFILYPIQFDGQIITKKDLKADLKISINSNNLISISAKTKSQMKKSTELNIRNLIEKTIKMLDK